MSIMKKLKKVSAIMLVGSSVVFVGCSGEKSVTTPTATPVATAVATSVATPVATPVATEVVSKVELNETAIQTASFSIKGPKGWKEETESGVIKIRNDDHELVTAVLIPVPGLDQVNIEDYKEEVMRQFKENTKIPLELKGVETSKFAGKNALVIEAEMAFTEEIANGWIQAGNLTQEDVDAAGGMDKFIEIHKISQVQVQILAKEGTVTIIGQTINDETPLKDIILAVAGTVVLKQ